MDKGVAFVRGINFYSSKRIEKEKILEVLKKAKSENLKILGGYKADNILFSKKDMHYVQVGKIFEVLSEKLNQKQGICI